SSLALTGLGLLAIAGALATARAVEFADQVAERGADVERRPLRTLADTHQSVRRLVTERRRARCLPGRPAVRGSDRYRHAARWMETPRPTSGAVSRDCSCPHRQAVAKARSGAARPCRRSPQHRAPSVRIPLAPADPPRMRARPDGEYPRLPPWTASSCLLPPRHQDVALADRPAVLP